MCVYAMYDTTVLDSTLSVALVKDCIYIISEKATI